jgi:PAS domain S-box-containing protein
MLGVVRHECSDTCPAQGRDAPEFPEEPLWQVTTEPREEALILLDLHGHVASWHDGARAIMGYEAKEIIGAHFSRLYSPAAIAGDWPEVEFRLAETEGSFAGEGWRVRRDGSCFWAQIVVREVRDRAGKVCGFGLRLRDLSKPKHAQALERNGSMKEFVSRLSHELRNPLAPIRSAVRLLRCKRLSESELEVISEMLDRDSAQLVALADDLLDVSLLIHDRIGLLSEGLDLASIIDRALEACLPVIDAHGQTLHVQLPEERVRLTADPVRLTQVLRNLLGNASRYTPDGGQIWLTVSSLEREVEILVRDNGIGMTPEFMSKAFDLFTQGERPRERGPGGIGVGLALARHVVSQHGGYLEVHSAGPGKGSECLIRLPVSGADSAVHGVTRTQTVTAQHDRHLVKSRHFAALNRLLYVYSEGAPSNRSSLSAY